MVDTSFNFLPTRPAAEIIAEYVRAVDYLYEPSNYLARTYQDILAMRPTRAAAGKHKGQDYGNAETSARPSGPAQRSGGAAPVDLATGGRGRLPVAILAAVSGGLPAQPQQVAEIPGKMRLGRKSLPDQGTPAGPSRPVRAGQNAAGLTGRPGWRGRGVWPQPTMAQRPRITAAASPDSPAPVTRLYLSFIYL